jgi:hypothetical protein
MGKCKIELCRWSENIFFRFRFCGDDFRIFGLNYMKVDTEVLIN